MIFIIGGGNICLCVYFSPLVEFVVVVVFGGAGRSVFLKHREINNINF